MINGTKKLDLAQRIAEAVTRTAKPLPPVDVGFTPSEGTVIGMVPLHLRHLYNLIFEIQEEAANVSQNAVLLAQEEVIRGRADEAILMAESMLDMSKVIEFIFNDSLEHHVPFSRLGFNEVICDKDWQVIGLDLEDSALMKSHLVIREAKGIYL